jgi:hypothetical protein
MTTIIKTQMRMLAIAAEDTYPLVMGQCQAPHNLGESSIIRFSVPSPLIGDWRQDRTTDLRVMKTPMTNTINYLHISVERENTPKYV